MENNWYDMYLDWINNTQPDLPPISSPPPTTAPFPSATPGGTPYPVTGNPFGPQPIVSPPPGQGLDFPPSGTPLPPPFQNLNAGTEAVGDTLGLPPDDITDQPPSTVATGGTPSGGQGDRNDDSGLVPGVDLSFRDRINQILHNMGLPPLPTNYTPFGGTPPDMVENRPGIGERGAPTFEFTNPTLNAGPPWVGSTPFGGHFANRGGFTPGSFAPIAGEASVLPSTWQMAMSRGIWGGRRPFTEQNFNNWQGWMNYQGNALQGAKFGKGYGPVTGSGMSYQDYLNTWNQLRSSGRTTGLGTMGMSPAALINAGAGTIAHGNKPFAAAKGGVVPYRRYEGGGVADDDFYAGIGRPVYGALRKGEDVSKNVFHALGELGKYLQSGVPNAEPASMIPSVHGTPRPRRSLPPSPDSLIEWMMTPQDEPPTTGRFLPQLYDTRASGAIMASRGRVIRNSMGMPSHGMPSMGMRNTDTVPAMLTPGEVVLNNEQQKAVMPVPGREQMLRKDQRAKLAQAWLT